MKEQLFSLTLTLVFLGTLLITFTWYMTEDDKFTPRLPTPQRRRAPKTYELCSDYKEVIEGIMKRYSRNWEKQDNNHQKFRSPLRSKCNGFDNAFLTRANTPVGSKFVYGENTIKVDSELFSLLIKEHPFSNKTWNTCAVVGNGGILADSGCGKMIDSAQFVIRCNLPPLENGYVEDVGIKTDLVTTNPSILKKQYGSLMKFRRSFVDKQSIYGNSMVMFAPFSLFGYTAESLQAAYTIKDFGGSTQPVLLNPEYQRSLTVFWRKQGLKERRLTTGLLVVSLALEICDTVHLYGFWPFNNHPYGYHNLKHHYYDDVKPSAHLHSMPSEFKYLLNLHRQGVLKVHLENCQTRNN